MSDYQHTERKIGQKDKYGLTLLDFMGPVELWHNPESGKYFVYMYVEPDAWTEKYLNVNRERLEDAKELFNYVCNIVANLPYRHPLNDFLSPYRPLSQTR